MTNVNIKLNLNNKLKNDLIQNINSSVIPKIEKRVITNTRDGIVSAMISVLRNDTVYKGLSGKYISHRKDLQAQFGLLPETAEEALLVIEKIFASSIRVQRRRDQYGLVIIADRKNIESDLLKDSLFSYISYNLAGNDTGHLIPWMQWILTKSGEANGFISFDTTNVADGRSQRAIMIPTPGIHWTVQNNVDLGEGNFIDRILNSEIFKTKAASIIEKEYRIQLNG